jgi:hypothetical protein
LIFCHGGLSTSRSVETTSSQVKKKPPHGGLVAHENVIHPQGNPPCKIMWRSSVA